MALRKSWRAGVVPLIALPLSATTACTNSDGTLQIGPVDKCSRIAESISFESIYVELIQGAEENNLGLDDETLKKFAQNMAADPSTKSMEFQSCLMAEGFKCLPTEGIDTALVETLMDAARASGWESPIPNTCLSPAGEVIENRFASG